MSEPQIRVMCVDDHPIVTEGLSAIINRQPDMAVVATATNREEALSRFLSERPDVTLMDLALGSERGVDAVRDIRRAAPDARIIILTVYHGEEDIFKAFDAGATSYVLKEEVPDELVRTIREVFQGHAPSMRPELEQRLAHRASGPTLTAREVQVLEGVSRGLRNKEIAGSLGISEETARVHVRNILSKLGVSDRGAAVNVGVRRGIIRIE